MVEFERLSGLWNYRLSRPTGTFFNVFFKIQKKHDFLRFFELPHTFSRTLVWCDKTAFVQRALSRAQALPFSDAEGCFRRGWWIIKRLRRDCYRAAHRSSECRHKFVVYAAAGTYNEMQIAPVGGSTVKHVDSMLSGLVVSALGIRTRGPRFESRVAPLFHWVATLGKLFTTVRLSPRNWGVKRVFGAWVVMVIKCARLS